jgi:hypothetical protein
LLLSGASVARGQQNYPYEAFARSAGTVVRCGPGHRYYETGKLPATALVEVHRRVRGGWLAIRPPQGSYSWVAVNHLRPTEEGDVAEAAEDGAVAWVGTNEPITTPHRWQVRLHLRERVEVLSQPEIKAINGGTERAWVKIAPPNGEFRWVHETDIERDPPGQVAVGRDEPQPPPQAGREDSRREETAVADEPVGGVAKIQFIDSSNRVASRRDASAGDQATDDGDDDDSSTGARRWINRGAEARRGTSDAGGRRRIELSDQVAGDDAGDDADGEPRSGDSRRGSGAPRELKILSDSEFENAWLDLNIALSEMAAKNRSRWDFGKLLDRAKQLEAIGSNSLQRGRARMLASNIERFRELEQDEAPAAGDRSNSTDPIGENPPELTASGEELPEYDVRGTLLPVNTRSSSVPRYVVVDKNREIVAFVSPAPGLNVRSHLKSEVGIFGDVRFVKRLDADHVTAVRVIPLDRHLRPEPESGVSKTVSLLRSVLGRR